MLAGLRQLQKPDCWLLHVGRAATTAETGLLVAAYWPGCDKSRKWAGLQPLLMALRQNI
jgi:hypothetical protein